MRLIIGEVFPEQDLFICQLYGNNVRDQKRKKTSKKKKDFKKEKR